MLSVNNEVYDLTDCRIKSMKDQAILLIVNISQCVGGLKKPTGRYYIIVTYNISLSRNPIRFVY